MAAEVAQVAQRCEEAKSSKELMLNSCGLRKFPDAVFFLLSGVDIQVLNLADNQFPKLPAKLASSPVFVSITSLDLSTNKLSTLPDTMPSLQHLTYINLSENNFESFPTILTQMPALRHINLSSNKIQAIEQGVLDSLPASLEEVVLSDNPLTEETKLLLQKYDKLVF